MIYRLSYNFERNLLTYSEFIISTVYTHDLRIAHVHRYLLDKAMIDSKLVKAFAISKCGVPNRTNVLTCIQFIIQRIIPNNEQLTKQNNRFNIEAKISELQDDSNEICECSICYEQHKKLIFIKLDCGHEFCKDCIKQSLQNDKRKIPCCALCRADIKNLEMKQESFKNDFVGLITSSNV